MHKRIISTTLIGLSLFGLFLMHPQKQEVKTINTSIAMVQADDEVLSEEASFIPASDVLNEKIAVNPNYEYESIDKNIYAKENEARIVTRPESNKQVTVDTLEKRETIHATGYNSFNDTYEVKVGNEVLYVNKKDFSEDIRTIFDSTTGKRFVANEIYLKKFPADNAENSTYLIPNTEVTLLGINSEGYYKVKVNGEEGYISASNLSETRVNYITPEQRKVAETARYNRGTYPCTAGYCAAWVEGCYQGAKVATTYGFGNAIDYWNKWKETGSTSMDNIPVGAVVVGSGSGSELGNLYGHVGIYLGDGLVAENIGSHRIVTLEQWAASQVGTCQGYQGYIGWVWPNGIVLGEGK